MYLYSDAMDVHERGERGVIRGTSGWRLPTMVAFVVASKPAWALGGEEVIFWLLAGMVSFQLGCLVVVVARARTRTCKAATGFVYLTTAVALWVVTPFFFIFRWFGLFEVALIVILWSIVAAIVVNRLVGRAFD